MKFLKSTRALLAIVNVSLLLTLLGWPVVAVFSPMLFAAKSELGPFDIAFVVAVVGYPLPIVIGNIGFWKHYRNDKKSELIRYSLVSVCSPVFAALCFITLLSLV
jgi:hypothetical protein